MTNLGVLVTASQRHPVLPPASSLKRVRVRMCPTTRSHNLCVSVFIFPAPYVSSIRWRCRSISCSPSLVTLKWSGLVLVPSTAMGLVLPPSLPVDGESSTEIELLFLGTGTSSSIPYIDCLTAPSNRQPCKTCLSTLTLDGKINIRRNTSVALRVTGRNQKTT